MLAAPVPRLRILTAAVRCARAGEHFLGIDQDAVGGGGSARLINDAAAPDLGFDRGQGHIDQCQRDGWRRDRLRTDREALFHQSVTSRKPARSQFVNLGTVTAKLAASAESAVGHQHRPTAQGFSSRKLRPRHVLRNADNSGQSRSMRMPVRSPMKAQSRVSSLTGFCRMSCLPDRLGSVQPSRRSTMAAPLP